MKSIKLLIFSILAFSRLAFAQDAPKTTIREAHIKSIRVLAFSADSKYLLSAGEDSTANVWDVQTGKRLSTFAEHHKVINAAAFSPDGEQIVTGGQDNMIRLWETKTGKEIRTFKGHAGYVIQLAFADKGDQIISGSTDKTIRIWDKILGKEIKNYKIDRKVSWHSVAFRPDGKFAILSDENRMRLMNLETGEKIRMYAVKEKSEEIDYIAFSPNGKKLLSVVDFQGGSLKVWDVSTALETSSLTYSMKGDPHYADVMMATFSADCTKLMGISNNGHLTIWDLNKNTEIKTFYNQSQSFKYEDGNVDYALAASPDGRWAAIANGMSLKIWDVSNFIAIQKQADMELIPASSAPKEDKPEEIPKNTTEVKTNATNMPEKIMFQDKEVKKGESINLKSVEFGQGSNKITTDSFTELNKVIDLMNQYPNITVELAGHTDGTGEADANMKLSEQRAEAVKTFLVEKGIDRKRIKTVAYGGTKPIQNGNDAKNRKINRRVELKILEM